ncbi:DUF4398 domain-containing protein [Roseateles sp. 22389]|uniref:DUF4398 domain-containing protein n=1 Tax=Roseateles sp. 22389 TaxID=3453916 RepID=UPI003F87DCCC
MTATLSPVSPLPARVLAMLTMVVTASLLGACASTPDAPPQLAVAEAAVQRANTPTTMADAPLQLRVATDKLAAAHAAVTAGDTRRAQMLSEQAEVDARVAELHADSMRSGKAAKESQDAARALSEEIQRKPAR